MQFFIYTHTHIYFPQCSIIVMISVEFKTCCLAVLLCLLLQVRAVQKFTMVVNFAKIEEKRLLTVLFTN